MSESDPDHRWALRYAVLTAALAPLLLWAFVTRNNFYPIPAWSLFSDVAALDGPKIYFELDGEDASGQVVPMHGAGLSSVLGGGLDMLVINTINNAPFDARSPHPANAALLGPGRSAGSLPAGVRMPDLLRAWGATYNRHHPSQPLRAVRLREMQWAGRRYADYAELVREWRETVTP